MSIASRAALAFLLAATSIWPSFAGEFTVYGPQTFVREPGGEPSSYQILFSSPVSGDEFHLKVLNGNDLGEGRISSGSLTLNGAPVIYPTDFNQQVRSISRTVPLEGQNQLSIALASVPRSYATVAITGSDNSPPQITIAHPSNGTVTDAETVDISGTVVDETPVAVSVNGIPASVDGQNFKVLGIPLEFGENLIRATATDLGGNMASHSIIVVRENTAPPPLTAYFRPVPSSGNAPLKVTFSPEPITDTAIQQYQWDLDGNGTFEITDTVGRNQSFTYTKPGTYNPSLRITDARGIQDTQTISLFVGNQPPVVTAQAVPSTGQVPLKVNFSGTATDSDGIASYEWDFDGDGIFDFNSATSASTSFTYTQVGTYFPVLRVTDKQGAGTSHASPAMEVRAAPEGYPTVTATASPVSGLVPLTVSFSGTASHPGGSAITQWEWDFEGDGAFDRVAASAPATFTFNTPGTYFPRLRVTAADGKSAEDVVEVAVLAKVSLSLNTDTLDTALGQTVSVNTQLSGATPVSVVIEDRSGTVVRTLIPWAVRPAGSYSDPWNGFSDAGVPLPEGPYYAVLLYEVNGDEKRLDHRLTTGGQQYSPSRNSIPSRFSPLAGQPLNIDFTLSKASEVTAFMGRYNTNVRLVTFMQRVPLGRGTHRITWNGENGDGQLIHPPSGDSFLFGIFGYYFPDNGIFVRSGPHVSAFSVSPAIFDPSEHADDLGTTELGVLTFTMKKPGTAELIVSDAVTGKDLARRIYTNLASGVNTVYWDGKDEKGKLLAPGRYRLGIAAIDEAGLKSMRVYALQRINY